MLVVRVCVCDWLWMMLIIDALSVLNLCVAVLLIFELVFVMSTILLFICGSGLCGCSV